MIVDRTGGNALLGSVLTVDGKAAVRMEDHYSTDIEDLWSAVTEPSRLARWIAQVEGDLRPAGEFLAIFTSGAEHLCRVDVCEPPRRLVVTMFPTVTGFPGGSESVIEALLAGDGDHTRLVVEHRGLPLDEADFHCAGWQTNIEDLAAYLAGKDLADWHMRYAELVQVYRERLAR
jgi:uncharacterized protein YndB with AHSA1/START domain